MNPIYQVEVAPYARSFRQPLLTSHGIWTVRSGAIVTLTAAAGTIAQGEIAPLEWFGTESLADALEFCRSLNGMITTEQILAIPDRLPCCQFAFESALDDPPKSPLRRGTLSLNPVPPFLRGARGDRLPPIATLLPTGPSAIDQSHYQNGDRCFKWKIGVSPIDAEIEWFHQLYQQLPQDCQLRLDANAGLSLAETERWLDELEQRPIEYLEQPLGIDQFATMKMLAEHYSTKLALDESIANLKSLQDCYNHGWTGVYVIKPTIVGSPRQLADFLHCHPIDVVFSSVFETAIGYTAGLRLADRIGCSRALGYGTQDW
jgi:o-succinylbenzoate synthase